MLLRFCRLLPDGVQSLDMGIRTRLAVQAKFLESQQIVPP
jgi:hypothetical protein